MTSVQTRTPTWWFTNVALPSLLIAVVAGYLLRRRDTLDELGDVSPRQLLLVAALTVAAHFINALEFGRLYRALGAQLGVVENWMLFTAGQLGNHLPGQLGTLYRFRYLNRQHELDLGAATAGYGANLVITILASGMTGLTGTIWIGVTESQWSIGLMAALIAFVGVGVGAAFIRLPASAADHRIARAWRKFAIGWHEIRADRSAALTVLILEVVRSVLTAWRLLLAFSWLGFDHPFAFFLVVGPTAALVTFIGFTPAGLGLRELAIGVTASGLGRSFEDGLVGSSVDRAVSLVVVTCLGLVGVLYTSRRLRQGVRAATT